MDENHKLEHISKILTRIAGESDDSTHANPTVPEPPYESPIEDLFAEHCFKFLSPSIVTEKQYSVETSHGIFRIDFLLHYRGTKIAIECDGKDFHNSLKDEIRDAILLGEGHCDTIYHFRGSDLVYYPDDCVWIISLIDKGILIERALGILESLRSPSINIDLNYLDKHESIVCNIVPPKFFIWIFRRSVYLVNKNPHLRYHWLSLFEFAKKHPRTSLDELYRLRVASWTNLSQT